MNKQARPGAHEDLAGGGGEPMMKDVRGRHFAADRGPVGKLPAVRMGLEGGVDPALRPDGGSVWLSAVLHSGDGPGFWSRPFRFSFLPG